MNRNFINPPNLGKRSLWHAIPLERRQWNASHAAMPARHSAGNGLRFTIYFCSGLDEMIEVDSRRAGNIHQRTH
jgi:hypothetical protein